MLINAYGKINLSLDITGKRPDGYHDIASVMQSVSLCDDVSIEIRSDRKVIVQTDCPDLQETEKNIAYKACVQMINDFNLDCGFDVFIQKRIPLAGGMAGGSTDAAAVIRGICSLCCPDASDEKLKETALKIGADVPFCLGQKAALATGIGEILTPVCGLPEDISILLVNPGVQVSTKTIYETIDERAEYGRVDNQALIDALQKNDVETAKKYMQNVMEPVTSTICPSVSRIINTMKENGAFHAMMTGSGATCFGLFHNVPDKEKFKSLFPQYYVEVTSAI